MLKKGFKQTAIYFFGSALVINALPVILLLSKFAGAVKLQDMGNMEIYFMGLAITVIMCVVAFIGYIISF